MLCAAFSTKRESKAAIYRLEVCIVCSDFTIIVDFRCLWLMSGSIALIATCQLCELLNCLLCTVESSWSVMYHVQSL